MKSQRAIPTTTTLSHIATIAVFINAATIVAIVVTLFALGACDSFGSYVASHSPLSCSHETGVEGSVWWACNVRSSAADSVAVPTFQPEPGACGLLVCEPPGGDARADVVAKRFGGVEPTGLECRKQGDLATQVPSIDWSTCLDPTADPGCAKVHEPCDSPLYTDDPKRQCCPGLVCSDVLDGTCCVEQGGSCGLASDCCADTTLGCTGGVCACTPIGNGCVPATSGVDSCCLPADCIGGTCCVKPGEACHDGSECCSLQCNPDTLTCE